MQAIQTKWIPASTNRPNRIKAFCAAGSITLCSDNLPHGSHDERSHRAVALELQKKLNWDFPMIGGDLKDGNYCFVLIPEQLKYMENADGLPMKDVLENYYE